MLNAVKITMICLLLLTTGCATIIPIIDDWAEYEQPDELRQEL